MCVACDLLTGLDLDELAAAEPAPWVLHAPDGAPDLDLARPLPATLRRVATLPDNHHWAPPSPTPEELASLLPAALSAYERYRVAAAAGRVAGGTRWLLALPSPFTWLSRSGTPEAEIPARLGEVEQALAGVLAALGRELPAADLALQWDLAAETALWESRGRDLTAGRRLAPRLLEGLVRLSGAWPAEAELGYHLCRRESSGEWAADPLDAAQISHLAGALLASLERDVGFLHLPGPRGPAEPEWYVPLTQLQAWPATALHLGLAWGDEDAGRVRERLSVAHVLLPRAHAAPACGPAQDRAAAVLGAAPGAAP